ncbi:amidohydrolase family protein [Paenibacillus sp. N4]|uniref:amidohydrolase family protein n=1 Tax=Paenibacillus vietnamensis TaxID=2590547 RepID=UPI001CD148F4|nr:amidohydrolase family protein [Paenibacillus vietnamensis]MCA0756230.1 amidohydrolase family protein [Paenibacillus vietnamensis]
MLDLLITDVRLPDEEAAPFDIGVREGVIVHLAARSSGSSAPDSAEALDAKGGMLLPGLIEPHIHLEKAYLLSRMEQEAASLQDAIKMTAEMKRSFTREDMAARSLAVVREAVRSGVTHMRCHAEVDPILGLSAFEAMLELKEKVKRWLDLQIVVFPQEGIYKSPGTAELMEEAMRLGGDVVGGITYQDGSLHEHLDFVFRLAEKHGKPIDFHADFSDNPEHKAIADIAGRTIASGMQGLVSAGHVTSLGSMEQGRAEALAGLIGRAGIHIMTLPATDLFINGRGDGVSRCRGLTPVGLLQEKGVNVVIGVNNVRNPFTPFGKADPLETAWLLAVTAYMGSAADSGKVIRMLTHGAAQALGIGDYGLKLGASADMVLFPASSERAILLGKPEQRTVWKRGVKTAETRVESVLSEQKALIKSI